MTQNDDSGGPARKERVIHTRVPAVLERELKRLATSLRVPVSNVVRTILEDAVHTLDAVGRHAEGELRGAAERLRRSRLDLVARAHVDPAEADGTVIDAVAEPVDVADAEGGAGAPAPAGLLAGVVGFQPMLLAKATPCSVCGRELAAGGEAFLGMRDDRGPRVVVGRECLPFDAAPAAAD